MHEAAGNCFSKGSTQDIVTWFNTPFNYVVRTNSPPPCKISTNPLPGSPNANYILRYASNDDEGICGTSDSGGPINIKYRRCPMPTTMAEYTSMVNTLTQQIASLESVVNKTWYQEYLLKMMAKCKNDNKILLVVHNFVTVTSKKDMDFLWMVKKKKII